MNKLKGYNNYFRTNIRLNKLLWIEFSVIGRVFEILTRMSGNVTSVSYHHHQISNVVRLNNFRNKILFSKNCTIRKDEKPHNLYENR